MTDTSGPGDETGRAEGAADPTEDATERADVEQVVAGPTEVDDAVDYLHHPDLSPEELRGLEVKLKKVGKRAVALMEKP